MMSCDGDEDASAGIRGSGVEGLLLGLPRGRTVRVPSCEWELPFGSVPMENVRPFEVSAKMWLLPDTSDVNLVVSQAGVKQLRYQGFRPESTYFSPFFNASPFTCNLTQSTPGSVLNAPASLPRPNVLHHDEGSDEVEPPPWSEGFHCCRLRAEARA